MLTRDKHINFTKRKKSMPEVWHNPNNNKRAIESIKRGKYILLLKWRNTGPENLDFQEVMWSLSSCSALKLHILCISFS